MHGGHDRSAERRGHYLSTLPRHAEVAAEQGLGSGGAQADDDVGLDSGDLGLQPGYARGYLFPVWALVNPPLASRRPLEVLDHVGDVNQGAVDGRRFERLVQDLAGGTDEGPARPILLVAWLLTDHQDPGALGSLAEHGLGGSRPEVAGSAAGCHLPEGGQRELVREQFRDRLHSIWHG